jgi:hypothetical protein
MKFNCRVFVAYIVMMKNNESKYSSHKAWWMDSTNGITSCVADLTAYCVNTKQSKLITSIILTNMIN